jgi:serine/threonine-protein kinase
MNEGEFRLAEDEFKKAIELSPNYASAHQWYSMLLHGQLRWEEAREHIEKAVELDPLSAPVNLNHGLHYAYQGDYTRAIEYCKRAAELGTPPAHWFLAQVYGRAKMYGEMRREFEINSELLAKSAPIVKVNNEALAAEFEGDKETARRLLPYLEAHSEDVGIDPYVIAMHHFCLGENDKGFEWLERSYVKNRGSLIDIQVDWNLNGVRTDPRYLDLLKRLGLDQTARQT